jgi:hypothetical protein
MRGAKLTTLVLTLLAAGLLLAGCGGSEQTDEGTPTPTAKGAATQKAAIQAYCDEIGLDMPDLCVSGDDGYGDKPTVSAEDPNWEIDYAFPADEEGGGHFFLLHKVDGSWTVVAIADYTDQIGWTAAQLEELGAPTDIVLDPSQEPAATQKKAIEAYCKAAGIVIPDMAVNTEDPDIEGPTASTEDPSWEIDYAFPPDAEGEGTFFLVHKVDGGWTAVASTDTAGWTADELKQLGAPADLAVE